ncbi:histone-lysine N-methyltransferase 2D-like [Osmerus eperlanus]|uniref:histone-lysine N-methyltransferase 2D-like n=1 Tax=Osmerus eperlanus TaxID=29151 RepID=UPI002E122C4A
MFRIITSLIVVASLLYLSRISRVKFHSQRKKVSCIMTDSGAGSSKPLKGILKKVKSYDIDSSIHGPECPLHDQRSEGPLDPRQGRAGPGSGKPLRGILKTSASCGAAEDRADSNSTKLRQRQRWDESNILATSCHSWLNVPKTGSHLCSLTMLDWPASNAWEEQTCLCISKRKRKSQSWNEMSILATQQPYSGNSPWIQVDDSCPAGVAWQSLSLTDDAETSPSLTSDPRPVASPPRQESNFSSYPPKSPACDRIGDRRRYQSKQEGQKRTKVQDEGAPGGRDYSGTSPLSSPSSLLSYRTCSLSPPPSPLPCSPYLLYSSLSPPPSLSPPSPYPLSTSLSPPPPSLLSSSLSSPVSPSPPPPTNSPSFEKLRKAHRRENRRVLLALRSVARDEEARDKDDATDDTVPAMCSCIDCCSSPSGAECTVQTSNQTDVEEKAVHSDP